MQNHMETIRKCSSGKSISIWILPYFSMEYQISGVLGEQCRQLKPALPHFIKLNNYIFLQKTLDKYSEKCCPAIDYKH